MAIKKNAAKATIKGPKKIPTKETVDTPMSECEAENPMDCKYHGLQAFKEYFGPMLSEVGYLGSFEANKLQGNKGYEIVLPGTYKIPDYLASKIVKLGEDKGFQSTYDGKTPDVGHVFLFKKSKPKKAKKKATTQDVLPLFNDVVESPDKAPGDNSDDEADILSQLDDIMEGEEALNDVLGELDDIMAGEDVDEGKEKPKPKSSKEIFAGLDAGLNEIDEVLSGIDNIMLGEEAEGEEGDEQPSWKEIKDFLVKAGFTDNPSQEAYEPMVLTGKFKDGKDIGSWKEAFAEAMEKFPSDNKVVKALKKWMDSGKAKRDEGLTFEEVKDFLAKNGLTAETKHGDTPFDEVVANWKGLIEDGQAPNGAKLEEQDVSQLTGFYDAAGPDNKVSQALWAKMVEKGIVDDIENKLPTFEEMKDFLKKGKILEDVQDLSEDVWSPIVLTGHHKNGEKIGHKPWGVKFQDAVHELPDHPVTKVVKKWLNDSEVDGGKDSAQSLKDEWDKKVIPLVAGMSAKGELSVEDNNNLFDATVDFATSKKDGNLEGMKSAIAKAYGVLQKKPTEEDWKEALEIAKKVGFPFAFVNGMTILKTADIHYSNGAVEPLEESNQNQYKKAIQEIIKANGKDAPVVKAMIAAYKSHPKYDMEGFEGYDGIVVTAKKDVESTTKPTYEEVAKKKTYAVSTEDLLKPLKHDEMKFPQGLTQKELDAAIAKGTTAGGHGGLGTTIVEIGGRKYVCKNGSGKKSKIIKNGYTADMAYRAGGIHAPDAKLYEFGDGKTYKLSEFVEGKKLIDVWKSADEKTRDDIRRELLKGYPLDALFSNYDVLGTSPEESQTVMITDANGKPRKTHVAFDNIIIGNDGNAYRIDNDGSFAMSGTGGVKTSDGVSLTSPVEYEHWDNWADRQWIDDFRTMRRNEKNTGIFDWYSTADIFTAAGNINLDAAVSSMNNPSLQKALEKPLFEMKQMTYRAMNLSLGGFKNDEFASRALDASYEASKKGLRELCKQAVAWNNPGYGKYKDSWGKYQMKPFTENAPEPPEDPKQSLSSKFKNEQYTGSLIGTVILNAAKTINHHGGVKQTDANGNVLGNGTAMANPDYDPNAAKIAEFEKIDREKLAELAKTDKDAETLLGLYDTIIYSKENGWKKPIGQIPTGLNIAAELPKDFKSKAEKKILDDMAGAIAEYNKAMEKYSKVDLPAYQKRKDDHKKSEEAKAKQAGGTIWHNFHHFADELIKDGYNTDGIAHKVETGGVAPIEKSMASQKGDSYNTDAVKWKVREMLGLGYSVSEIEKMASSGALYNGSHYTNIISKYLKGDPTQWAKDMASQAMYCGLQMIKLENELSDLYDKESGVVFLNRNISTLPKGLTDADKQTYQDSSKSGWVSPHLDSAADCMQFESNSWSSQYKQVYAVPFSRLVCCGNNHKADGGGFGYDNEQEYVGNLIQLPCWVYHSSQSLTWKGAVDKAKASDGMKSYLSGFAKRLGAFNTLL